MRLTAFSSTEGARRLARLALLAALLPPAASAEITGETGSSFQLVAREGRISVPDGGSFYAWGYANGAANMQFPGPTLIVTQGSVVTVTLQNALPAAAGNVSVVFPGQEVTPTGGVPGLLTNEALPGGTVTYSFLASRPGTFLYHSGTRPDLQVEMGLAGALIVRPAGSVACPIDQQPAYDHPGSCYHQEQLFLLSELDAELHRDVEHQIGGPGPIAVRTSPYRSEYWLINGRAAPDTMAAPGTAILTNQPYDAMVLTAPHRKVLMRVIEVGRQLHPFHHHGNNARLLARDGHLLVSPGGALIGPSPFTISVPPGGTADAIWDWTGKGLGWDAYGHVAGDGSTCTPDATGFDPATGEWCADHTLPLPVDLPHGLNLTVGGFWSGSPFLGAMGSVPPGEGGLNPWGGFAYMWHSHTERELTNNDVFPGGMLTMAIVAPAAAVPLP